MKAASFSNEELHLMQKGVIQLIDNANSAMKILNDDSIAGQEINDYKAKLMQLLVKIGKCET